MNPRHRYRIRAAAFVACMAIVAAGATEGVIAATGLTRSSNADGTGASRGTSAPSADTDSTGSRTRNTATDVDLHHLPLGDGKYTSSGPRKGYAYNCQTDFYGGGAFRQGPWIDSATGTWDKTEKIWVRGSVRWSSRFSAKASGSALKLSGNGLPSNATGIFPVQSSDPAYQYDRNPNSIRSYGLSVWLPRNPTAAATPSCIGGTVGVAKDGVPIYSAFDAGGRDAVATEIQDRNGGHPEITGQYHYHDIPSSLIDPKSSARAQLVGWALDGYGIYVERDSSGNRHSSADLDACHGTTSRVRWHGKTQRVYHYVATEDFPYTVACFKGTPITSATGLRIGPA